jgi:hypothetical protein
LRLWLGQEGEPTKRAEIRILMARVMRLRGMFAAARTTLEAGLAEDPENAQLQRSLGLELFRNGEIAKGLALYDSGRWRLSGFEKYKRDYPFPTWSGEPVRGKRILLWAEQGIGDQIMQLRAVPTLLELGAEVFLEADPRLEPLLGALGTRISFVPQMTELNAEIAKMDFDYQTSCLSAWRWLEAPLANGDCLTADPALRRAYQNAWGKIGPGPNVGLSWRSANAATGAMRSVELRELRPLTAHFAGTFHNLQYGDDDPAATARAFGRPVLTDPVSDPLTDLTRQAAQIAELDLVITIDNATAHLAGALGKPVWILLPKGSEWRWGSLAKPQHLYPGQRVFRSGDSGDWAGALWSLFNAFEAWSAA